MYVLQVVAPFQIAAFWCWYKGDGFHGYQAQQGVRTVQGELLRAFREVGLSRNPVVAGRTDKGVSARMQVLSGRVEREVELQSLPERLNAVLPAGLGIHLVRAVPHGFHAAWSANSKEYRYELATADAGDVSQLVAAAALIPGTRNFRAFHFKSSEERLRTVTAVHVDVHQQGVTLRFVGEGFARYMVRMLVGAMTAVSRGTLASERFAQGLYEQQNFHCPTAPAEPLTLWEVSYPPAVDPFTAQERSETPTLFLSPGREDVSSKK